jgi:multiple sugar transport system permease protein
MTEPISTKVAIDSISKKDSFFHRWMARRRIKKEAEMDQEGSDYLLSFQKRLVMTYLPIGIFMFILLFPFYWMTLTSFKPDEELINTTINPWLVYSPTLAHFKRLLFHTAYPSWMWNTMLVAVCSTVLSLVASLMAAYAIVRIRYTASKTVGGLIFLAYLVPPSILFIPLALIVYKYGLFDSPMALILTYPTILIPFSTWLLMGYFKTIPYELEECALIDGATRTQILTKIVLPLAIPGIISAGIFSFTLCWNEFIYALTFISSSENKTVPTAVLSELIDGDVYHWGALMAGALLGSVPVALVCSFFVEHYVSSMTGAVKE